MKNRQYVQLLYIGVALLTFSPFLYYGFISSDWDSYASIASGNILILENIYIPSRPPGFPIYEIILAPLSLINTRIALIFTLYSVFFCFYSLNLISIKVMKKLYYFFSFLLHQYT